MVLDCLSALSDTELDEQERYYASLFIFYSDIKEFEDIFILFGEDINIAIEKMVQFFNCNQQENNKPAPKLMDWEQDSQLIVAAVNNVAHTEIRALPYLHWWTFMGYYMSIGESAFSTVVGIRNKIATNKKLEKYEKEFKQNNPQYFNFDYRSQQQKEADELVRSMWNSNK